MKRCILKLTVLLLMLVSSSTNAMQDNVSKKRKSTYDPGIKSVGGSVDLTGAGQAELNLVIVLEEGWDTFGFPPQKGIEIQNKLDLHLPDAVTLVGDLVVTSDPIIDAKYFDGQTLIPRYSGVVELKQELSVDESIQDFSSMTVTGRLFCIVSTEDTSLASRTPFVLFFRDLSRDPDLKSMPDAPPPKSPGKRDRIDRPDDKQVDKTSCIQWRSKTQCCTRTGRR